MQMISGTSVLVLCTGVAFVAHAVEGVANPGDLAAVCGWYDAADASTITDAGGGAVSTWKDKSGNNYDLTEATNRPTTGTRTINGLNTLDFDGVNDQLRCTTAIDQYLSAIYVVVSRIPLRQELAYWREQSNTGGALYQTTTTLNANFSSNTVTVSSALAASTPVLCSVRSISLNGIIARAGRRELGTIDCRSLLHQRAECRLPERRREFFLGRQDRRSHLSAQAHSVTTRIVPY